MTQSGWCWGIFLPTTSSVLYVQNGLCHLSLELQRKAGVKCWAEGYQWACTRSVLCLWVPTLHSQPWGVIFFFPQHFCTSMLQRAWILFRKVFDNTGGHRKSLVYCLEVCSDVTAAAQFCPPNLPRPGGWVYPAQKVRILLCATEQLSGLWKGSTEQSHATCSTAVLVRNKQLLYLGFTLCIFFKKLKSERFFKKLKFVCYRH